jgi:hypothetical protein
MEIIIYIIPFITAIFLLIVFNKKMVWWEYAALILPSLLFVLLTRVIMVSTNSNDTEYLGGYVNRITYYEPWDEMVEVRHTRTNSDGETEVYYTWEREYHSETYTYVDNESKWEHHLSKKEYETIKKRMGNKTVFRDMHRNYHRIDGDAYDIFWDGKVETLYDITTPHSYTNKIKASQSHTIFKMGDISPEEAKEMGLYEYPEIYSMNQNPIIGRDVSDKDKQRIKYINATYGEKYQFRTYVLIYENKDITISEIQKAYWQNGNKNEFVLCLGVQRDSVVWANAFSWCDEPRLEVKARDYFIQNPKLDINQYGEWLQTQIPTQWDRKEFEDFAYIRVGLSQGQYIALIIIMIVLNIGISIFLVKNEFNNENNYGM